MRLRATRRDIPLDVNLLMARLWENHEHHRIAREWLTRTTDFATCPVSQLGFARVSSHPLLGYSMSPDQAFGVLRRFLADSRHHFVPDDLSCADRIVRTDLMGGREPGHRPLPRGAGAAPSSGWQESLTLLANLSRLRIQISPETALRTRRRGQPKEAGVPRRRDLQDHVALDECRGVGRHDLP